MAHRNYSKPRSGNLGFLPKARCHFSRPHIKYFPPDDITQKPHLTGFITYKAGCTHVMGLVDERSTEKKVIKQVIRNVTVLDAPQMIGAGIVGYTRTPHGYKPAHTVWAAHLADSVKRRFQQSRNSTERPFAKHETTVQNDANLIAKQLEVVKNECQVIRLICHTQPEQTPLLAKKAQIIEIQVNGGNVAQKVDFAAAFFEKPISIKDVFHVGQQLDAISITRGRGFEGVITRWNVTRLPRKTRRGNRKVACIGAWHPANVQYTVARAGQQGYFHRSEQNKTVIMIDSATNPACCKTDFDTTDKGINPLGGWVNYGTIRGDFIMISGSCPGTKKRTVCLREAILPHKNVRPLTLQWVCTSSKMGHGMFETAEEKKRFYNKKVAAQ